MIRSIRRLVWLSSYLAALGILGVFYAGCPDPEGEFSDFEGRLPEAADAAPMADAGPCDPIPDVSGTFLVGLTNNLLTGSGPILFLSTQTVDTTGGGYTVSLSFQPLHKVDRTPVGSPVVFPDVEVSSTCTFQISLPGELTIPAEANTLLDLAIVANSVVIRGQITSVDNHCGTLTGTVTAPIPADLEQQNTTYGAIRVSTTTPPFPTPEIRCGTSSTPDAGAPDAPSADAGEPDAT